jgi:hypothetical protein
MQLPIRCDSLRGRSARKNSTKDAGIRLIVAEVLGVPSCAFGIPYRVRCFVPQADISLRTGLRISPCLRSSEISVFVHNVLGHPEFGPKRQSDLLMLSHLHALNHEY